MMSEILAVIMRLDAIYSAVQQAESDLCVEREAAVLPVSFLRASWK